MKKLYALLIGLLLISSVSAFHLSDVVEIAKGKEKYQNQDPSMDMNDDGVINLSDWVMFIKQFGKKITKVTKIESSSSGSSYYRCDLDHRRYCRIIDSQGKDKHKFIVNETIYYIDLEWKRVWNKGWKPSEFIKMTLYEEETPIITKLVTNGKGTVMDIEYEIRDYRNVAFKKIKLSKVNN